MRLISTCFALTSLSFACLIAAHSASQVSMSARPVGDTTLARVWGTNGGQGGSGSYSCDNVNSSGSNQVSQTGCTAYTPTNPPPANMTCVECNGDYTTGNAGGTGTPIMFIGAVNCSGQMKVGACELGYGSNNASCFTPNPNGKNCGGSFNEWQPEPVASPQQ